MFGERPSAVFCFLFDFRIWPQAQGANRPWISRRIWQRGWTSELVHSCFHIPHFLVIWIDRLFNLASSLSEPSPRKRKWATWRCPHTNGDYHDDRNMSSILVQPRSISIVVRVLGCILISVLDCDILKAGAGSIFKYLWQLDFAFKRCLKNWVACSVCRLKKYCTSMWPGSQVVAWVGYVFSHTNVKAHRVFQASVILLPCLSDFWKGNLGSFEHVKCPLFIVSLTDSGCKMPSFGNRLDLHAIALLPGSLDWFCPMCNSCSFRWCPVELFSSEIDACTCFSYVILAIDVSHFG